MPLLSLMQTSQNFPAQVVGISRTSIPDSLRKSYSKLRSSIREQAEVFSLNGALVRPDHSDLSLFPMMKSLLPYFIGIERLVRIGLPEAIACELLKDVHKGTAATPQRLDWRSPHLPGPCYHVQKDKKSQRWGASLQALMYAFPGGLAPVRLPLYTVVFIFDPAEVADLQSAVGILAQTPLPITLHMVLLPPGGGPSGVGWDEEALGPAPEWVSGGSAGGGRSGDRMSTVITAAYGAVLQEGPKHGRLFLKGLAEWAKDNIPDEGRPRWPDTSYALAAVRKIFTQRMPADTVNDEYWDQLVRGVGPFAAFLAGPMQYATTLGVPAPCMLINGKLLLKGAYEGQMVYQTIGMEQQLLQRAMYMGQLQDEDGVEGYITSQGLLTAYHQDITPEIGTRGGEEGMPGQSTSEASYFQWPAEAFLKIPSLDSIEPPPADENEEETASKVDGGALGLFHVTVLSQLSHSYLLHTFASHLLAPPREVLKKNKQIEVPPLSSHWSMLVDTSKASNNQGAMSELGTCIRGLLRASSHFKEVNAELNQQKLKALKFLGAALSATAGLEMTGQRVRELCELAIQRKIDPDHQANIKALISKASEVDEAETTLIKAASAGHPEGAALWVCNGRRIALEADGQPVSPRHVQALELLEAQYDVQEVESEEAGGDDGMMGMMGMMGMGMMGGQPKAPPPPRVKALNERLAGVMMINKDGKKPLPVKAHGLVAAIRSEALSAQRNERFEEPRQIFEQAPAAFRLHLPPARPEAASPITVYGIVDPLSTTAQSASAVLALFGMAFNAEVNLVLNPRGRLSEYPLKRYYREVIRWPDHLADGRAVAELDAEVGGASATLALATKHTLTAAVHALPTWLVTAYEALHDMDNLRQVDIGDGKWCETTYMLRQLYVEGQAFVLGEEGFPIAPAKGLQIDVAGKGSQEVLSDTIVMGNLGYFQIRGNPGLYEAQLKSGLSNDTFEVAKAKDVEVSSYITPPYQLRVITRPGRSPEDMEQAGASGWSGDPYSKKEGTITSRIMGGLKSMWGSSDTEEEKEVEVKDAVDTSLPTIYIFSVASGHLYEKLMGIMILSVRNKTQCPLHFLFIDNFLSPKFKAFIPYMARRYNFNFDFVTYKWPSWLNPQSEKQRLIWAYKVLFLDVLFPLDVPKVIFIDADQVVRADVRELWDWDLKGSVYGFVPMGDTNLETEGFRFWKQGYWKSHLGSLPYHISALFVVDLNEFRRTSVGDSLRGVYNQLSRDPNSLSNLEQDLINFAQHQVPIHSLPADWLWCETWCSQEAKKTAKTIDLCQNPLTKEPKIVMARRIIAEWGTYHDEVQAFQESVRLQLLTGDSARQASENADPAAASKGKVEL